MTKMLVRTLVLLAMCLAATAAVLAEEKATDDTPFVTGTLSGAIRTGYLAKPGIMCHSEMVVESELRLKLRMGLYAGIWGCYPFEKAKPVAESKPQEGGGGGEEAEPLSNPTLQSVVDLANATGGLIEALHPKKTAPAPVPFEGEVDYYVGYALRFGGDWSLDTSLAWYDFNLLGHSNDDQWTAQVALAYEGWKRTRPSIQVGWYGKTGKLSPPDSLFVYLGLDQSVKLFTRHNGEEQTLNLSGSVAFSDGKLLGSDAGPAYARLGASTDIKIVKDLVLTPSLMYQRRLTDGEFAKENEFIGGVALTWNF